MNAMGSRVTMRDVAAAAGVHQTTVSLALANDRRLPAATRQRVARIASKLGYRPHPLLSVLGATRRSGRHWETGSTLAFVMPADSPGEAHGEYLSAVRQTAWTQGYGVAPFIVGVAGLTPKRLSGVLKARRIQGALIAPFPAAHGSLQGIDWEDFCAVSIEHTLDFPMLDRVANDAYGGMRLAMRRCRERGLRRVGLLLSANGHARTEEANGAAYWIEQKTGGHFAAVPPLYLERWDGGAVRRWLRGHGLEAVVTSGTFIDPLRDLLPREGMRVPEDISLVSINTSRNGEISGIYQNIEARSALAARLLIDKINRNDYGIPDFRQTVLTLGSWLEGFTLRPPA